MSCANTLRDQEESDRHKHDCVQSLIFYGVKKIINCTDRVRHEHNDVCSSRKRTLVFLLLRRVCLAASNNKTNFFLKKKKRRLNAYFRMPAERVRGLPVRGPFGFCRVLFPSSWVPFKRRPASRRRRAFSKIRPDERRGGVNVRITMGPGKNANQRN